MEVPGPDRYWRSPQFRQKVVAQIEEAMRKAGTAHTKSSNDMENHVYVKAKSREEYLSLVARLIIHFRDIHKKTLGGPVGGPGQMQIPQMQQAPPPQQQQSIQFQQFQQVQQQNAAIQQQFQVQQLQHLQQLRAQQLQQQHHQNQQLQQLQNQQQAQNQQQQNQALVDLIPDLEGLLLSKH